jgi:hypothetical protein
MSDTVQRLELDHRPDAETISSLREQAQADDCSVEAHFPSSGGQKRLVVSARGTVVLLNDVSEETFNQSRSADEIAEALRN